MSFYRVRNVKACRKTKRCDWCGEAIKTGDPKAVESYLTEDCDFDSRHLHPECLAGQKEWEKSESPNFEPVEFPGYPMRRGSPEPR